MGLNRYRKPADKHVATIAKPFMRFNPNTLTWMGMLTALIAGLFLYIGEWYLLLGSVFIFLSSGFDAVDGKVAKATGRASKRGDFLDHVLDRYGDVFIMGAIAIGPYCDRTIGILGISSVLLVSYVGVQAHALSGKRNYSGLVGRADRLVILIIAPVVQYIMLGMDALIFGFTFFEMVMLWFLVGGQMSVIQRGVHVWKDLKEK